MSQYVSRRLERLLQEVEKPGRYVGAEVNSVAKKPHDVRASMLLAFPDVYDVGMSYHGFKILYERINAVASWAAERTYAPWPDMERRMRAEGVPLFSTETKRRALTFDLIGFTLQHEVNYTNVLNMIDLAGAPVEAADRFAAFPLIIAGGEGALTPEPLAPFIDLFILGDGERTVMELMALVEVYRENEHRDKQELLRLASLIPGVYVPSFCEWDYNVDGTIKRLRDCCDAENPAPFYQRQIFNISDDLGSVKPVIPNLRVIHDRPSIEIKRGCVRGCRFCAAGMTNRPVRERTPEQILEIARQNLANTGYDELSLLSLSSADHSCILPTVRMLQDEFHDERVSISLPSLRINSFDVSLADELAQVRKSGFTFAPEAGTERLRAVINKPLDEEVFLKIIELVCAKGWKTLKFYFMIGLPTETDEDLDGIVNIVKRAEEIGRRRWNSLQINVGLSPFVPKPHTPFQWAAQLPAEELERRHRYVAGRLRSKRISIKGQDRRLSFIEAVLARGDRRMASAIKRAWELGAKFDGWDEHFRFDVWQQAFAESGIDPAFYANRERGHDEALPWDHIDSGPGRDFLLKEWRLALGEKTVPDCSLKACVGCNVCDGEIDHSLASEHWAAPPELLQSEGHYDDMAGTVGSSARRSKDGKTHQRLTPSPEAVPSVPRKNRALNCGPDETTKPRQRLRIRFSRTGGLRHLAHLDVVKILQLACVRARLKPAYSEGFNPRPKMSFMPPLPVGYETQADYFDLVLMQAAEPQHVREELNAKMPLGMCILEVQEIDLHVSGPEALLQSADYEMNLRPSVLKDQAIDSARIVQAVEEFYCAEELPFTRMATDKRPARQLDLKTTLLAVRNMHSVGEGLSLTLEISHLTGEYADPITCLNTLLGTSLSVGPDVQVVRVESHFT